MDSVAPWILMFVALLLLYPIERRKAHEGNFTFWKWVLKSILVVGTAFIIYTLMRALGLFGDG